MESCDKIMIWRFRTEFFQRNETVQNHESSKTRKFQKYFFEKNNFLLFEKLTPAPAVEF